MKLLKVEVTRKEWNPGVLTSVVNMYFTDGFTWGFQLDDGMTLQEVADRLLRVANYQLRKLAESSKEKGYGG
jgi:hypothetical protein